MTFIVRCPDSDCRKFMLLEDDVRGTRAKCLVCQRSLTAEPDESDDPAGPSRQVKSPAKAPNQAGGIQIVDCPNCGKKLRLSSRGGKPIRCPACKQVFSP